MLFFAMMAVVAAVAAAAGLLLGHGLDMRAAMVWGMILPLLFFGVDHLVKPGRYLPMMPDFVPRPREVVLFTGLCEIAGGIGLLAPAARLAAGWALAVYFVCVFPANLKNALQGLSVDGLPSNRAYYWARLPFQPVAIAWALYASGALWPAAS